MKRIESLTVLRSRLAYDAETGQFTWMPPHFLAGQVAGSRDPRGYIVIRACGGRHWAHRLAWLFVHGASPIGDIDHINGDKSDNRLANLRDVNRSTNLRNRPAAGVRGVTWHRRARKWAAGICVNYRHVHLGLFSDIEDAKSARGSYEKAHGLESLR